VLLIDEGNSARQILGAPEAPVRTLVVGIVDAIELATKPETPPEAPARPPRAAASRRRRRRSPPDRAPGRAASDQDQTTGPIRTRIEAQTMSSIPHIGCGSPSHEPLNAFLLSGARHRTQTVGAYDRGPDAYGIRAPNSS
jgi:hypothetical protein